MVNNPNIRFAGFSDEWVQRKLENIADRFDNLRVPITASVREPGDTPYYGANGIQDYVEGFTHEGEFILVAEDGANDLKNYPVQYVNGKVWVNNHAHVLQGKETITDNKFLMNAIKNFNIEPFLVGGGRAKLNADVMMKLNILLPTLKEQQKIGSVFSTLDHKIGLEERQIELLKNLKKGYLQKMFPKNGTKVPELRFAGFADDWEERKLGDVSDIKNGKGHSGLTHGIIPMYGTGGYMSDVNASLSDVDAIGIGQLGTIGKPHILKSPFWAINTLFYAVPHDDVDINFVTYSLTTFNWSKYNETSTVPKIPLDRVKTTKLNLPSKQEQEKIGQIINLIDSIIDNYSREVTQLELLKKGLLQNLFI